MRMKVNFLLAIALLIAFSAHAQRITKVERELIKSGKTNEKMHVSLTSNANDLLVLRSKSIPISQVNANIWKILSKRMLTTVEHPDHNGVGIAAPQVGINRQLILVKRFDKEDRPFETFVNPKIIAVSDSIHGRIEGCLSIPVVRENVYRPWSIVVQYHKLNGDAIEETIEGHTARIVQHEVDHLNAILFTDYSINNKLNSKTN